jgi:hypothetical protein
MYIRAPCSLPPAAAATVIVIEFLPAISANSNKNQAMASLVKSFASLYCQKLRSTTRLGPAAAAPPRLQVTNRRVFSFSSGGAAPDARPPPALPRQFQEQQRTPFFTW